MKLLRNSSSDHEEISAEFNRLDRNGDLRLTPDELPDQYREPLMKADIDQDGAISIQEFKRVITIAQQRDELQELMFYQLDINDDDYLSPDELPERLHDRLMPADHDQSGTISLTEFQDFLQQELPSLLDAQPSDSPAPDPNPSQLRDPEQVFQSLDTNHDNRITMDEIPLQGRPRLMRADLNADNIITQTEFRAAVDQFGELR